MLPAKPRPALFFGAVADAGGHVAVLPLRDDDSDGYLLVHQRRFLERCDVGKLEELEAVQLPLAVAHVAAGESIAGPERHLPPNHVLADTDGAVHIDRTEVRKHA